MLKGTNYEALRYVIISVLIVHILPSTMLSKKICVLILRWKKSYTHTHNKDKITILYAL